MPDTETLPEAERIRRLEITVGHMADGFHPRISDAEEAIGEDRGRIAELHLALSALLERVDYLEAQKQDETDRYVELRRIIKVIALTPVLAEWGFGRPVDDLTGGEWEAACAEVHRRYGHLQFDGRPLWSKPPGVSDETKALIAESLKRRQEA